MTIKDISADLTKIEKALHRANRALDIIVKCHKIAVQAKLEQELFEQICHVLVDNIQYQLAWIGYAKDDKDKWCGHKKPRHTVQTFPATASPGMGDILWLLSFIRNKGFLLNRKIFL
jgi:hypothetical protein